jgi:hypothetical protein
MKHTIEITEYGYLIDDVEEIRYSDSFGFSGWYRKSKHVGMFPPTEYQLETVLYEILKDLDSKLS